MTHIWLFVIIWSINGKNSNLNTVLNIGSSSKIQWYSIKKNINFQILIYFFWNTNFKPKQNKTYFYTGIKLLTSAVVSATCTSHLTPVKYNTSISWCTGECEILGLNHSQTSKSLTNASLRWVHCNEYEQISASVRRNVNNKCHHWLSVLLKTNTSECTFCIMDTTNV